MNSASRVIERIAADAARHGNEKGEDAVNFTLTLSLTSGVSLKRVELVKHYPGEALHGLIGPEGAKRDVWIITGEIAHIEVEWE